MYVNTLITLQENLSTYGIDGKKVTGHVTITSPGLIKCYVQNLKKQPSGQTYALYAFSKTKDKGVRLGNLGSEKETKWITNGKNIENSGINIEEIDGVAIVVEDNMRGADTILMGFKNNRYMIIPLIDDIFKKKTRPGNPPSKPGGPGNPPPRPGGPGNPPPRPEGPGNPPPRPGGSGNPPPRPGGPGNPPPKSGRPEDSLPKPPNLPGNPPPKPDKLGDVSPRNEIKIGIMVEPDPVPEGREPIIIPETEMQNQEKTDSVMPSSGTGPFISPGGPGPVIIPQTGIQNQGGPGPFIPLEGLGPAIISQAGMQNQGGTGPFIPQEGLGPAIVPPTGMQNQEGPGPVIPPGDLGPAIISPTGMQNLGGPGPVIVSPTGMQNQGESEPSIPEKGPRPVTIQQIGMQNQNGSEVSQEDKIKEVPPKDQETTSTEQEFTKVKILDKRIESVDLELRKIAEKLKQIGKKSKKQDVKSETTVDSNDGSEVAKIREVAKNDQDEVSKELQRIINMLKENQEIKQKTKGIEEQIERMRKLPQLHKLIQKSNLEKTLESHYMSKKLTEEEQEDEVEEGNVDTSPRNALNFMLAEKQAATDEEEINSQDNHQIDDFGKKEDTDCQDEIDYIHEIDKKIREIEAKRQQQKNNI